MIFISHGNGTQKFSKKFVFLPNMQKSQKIKSKTVNRRTDNAMHKEEEQTIQCTKEEEQTIQCTKEEEQTIQCTKEEGQQYKSHDIRGHRGRDRMVV